jgi:crotonobetainyl-CoA:carnitine CoA-transferase CaiB-like acyl-CoA transferase
MSETSTAAADGAPAAVQQGPLVGVRVVELGILLAGPFVGRILGDFGAEIIKVEAPTAATPCATGARDTSKDAGCGGQCSRATRS